MYPTYGIGGTHASDILYIMCCLAYASLTEKVVFREPQRLQHAESSQCIGSGFRKEDENERVNFVISILRYRDQLPFYLEHATIRQRASHVLEEYNPGGITYCQYPLKSYRLFRRRSYPAGGGESRSTGVPQPCGKPVER